MAKVRNNIIVRGISGDLGKQLVIRTSKLTGETNIYSKPDFETTRQDSPAQLAHRQAFREASAYATAKKEDPIYLAKASSTGRRPYNIAMADWFHAPEILKIDLEDWNGASGEVIRILVHDDILVKQVSVAISDGTDAVRESGQAVEAAARWWEYTVQQALSGGLTVTVSARDLPGHVTTASERKIIAG